MDLPVDVGTGLIHLQIQRTGMSLAYPHVMEITPVSGRVNFTPSPSSLRHLGTGTFFPTQTISAVLDANGAADVELMATDDPQISPLNFSYLVYFELDDVYMESFNIDVPEGSDRNLTDLAPIPSTAGVYEWYLPNTAVFSVPGVLTVSTGASRLYNDSGMSRTITSIRASVGTAPTGAVVRVDAKKNGTSLFPVTTKPTIAIGTNTALTVPDTTLWATGDYLTVDVTAIGSPVAGANLTVAVSYR
jgi:hypothetical protein